MVTGRALNRFKPLRSEMIKSSSSIELLFTMLYYRYHELFTIPRSSNRPLSLSIRYVDRHIHIHTQPHNHTHPYTHGYLNEAPTGNCHLIRQGFHKDRLFVAIKAPSGWTDVSTGACGDSIKPPPPRAGSDIRSSPDLLKA